jgi:site-specific DNA recombinase
MRVAAYYRVSTTRQAEKDLSIPDQKHQAVKYCDLREWELVREFVEAGASAIDDNRSVFQDLIDFATGPERPVDVILVHSFSRFFRDGYAFEHYRRRLKRHEVSVISMTQEVADNPQGDLIRNILTSFDAYASAETAKHVLRSMQENARQGFWNGSRPPFGYRTVEAERRGDKIKKKLAIAEGEAQMVQIIYGLYTAGNGDKGPMGVKAIADHLNTRGMTLRGRRFHVSNVYDILTRSTYGGTHYFNRMDSKTRRRKPREQWIAVETPAILESGLFERVQATLKARNPKKTPPRVVSGPTLLTGILRCSICGGGMTLRTGKSGRYRYYTCSTCARQGKSVCPGRTVRMEYIDQVILDQLATKLFTPERLRTILTELMDRSKDDDKTRQQKLAWLRREHKTQEAALANLYKAIENGVVDIGDAQLRERIVRVKMLRDERAEEADLLNRQINNTNKAITPEKLEAFSSLMHEKLFEGSPAFRRAYLHLFVDRIELDEREIRIRGSKRALAKGISTPAKLGTPEVPSFVREWCARQDSNL